LKPFAILWRLQGVRDPRTRAVSCVTKTYCKKGHQLLSETKRGGVADITFRNAVSSPPSFYIWMVLSDKSFSSSKTKVRSSQIRATWVDANAKRDKERGSRRYYLTLRHIFTSFLLHTDHSTNKNLSSSKTQVRFSQMRLNYRY
jgi:hypothetical protein